MPCPSDTYRGLERDGVPWSNWVGSVTYRIEKYFEPDTLPDLVNVVARASKADKELRALGSGWGYDDIAASADWVVSLRRIAAVLDTVVPAALTEEWQAVQRDNNSPIRLVHVEAGIEIGVLNLTLQEKSLAMITLGGANGQNIAGAISTSTHGGDPGLPPLADLVQAIHLVTVNGQEWWIERGSEPPVTRSDLLQPLLCKDAFITRDDSLFNAVLVAAGRFGVVYSYVLKVAAKAYRLSEWAVFRPRQAVVDLLQTGIDNGTQLSPLLDSLPQPAESLKADTTLPSRFVEIVFNSQAPYDGCWITRRWPTVDETDLNMDTGRSIFCNRLFVSAILEAAGAALFTWGSTQLLIPGVGVYRKLRADFEIARFAVAGTLFVKGGEAVSMVLNAMWSLGAGELIPALNKFTLQSSKFDKAEKGRRGLGHLIMTGTREANQDDCYKGESIELVFPANGSGYLNFLNAIFPIASAFHQAGYISLRYSAPSKALISMHNFNAPMVVSIEISSLAGLDGNGAWIRFVHDLAIAFGGRPHWGQMNTLTAPVVEQLYGPQLTAWREELLRVSGTSTTFSNQYTRRRGLEPQSILRKVIATRKDKKRRITHLCGGPGTSWSPIMTQRAIEEIQSGLAVYFTQSDDGKTALVQVVGEHLRTTADTTDRNNLDELPDC